MEKLKKVWTVIQDYVIASALVMVGLFFVLQLWNSNLATYPLQYGMGDDMTAAMTIKTMQENGWIYKNSLLGAPNPEGTNSFDATTGEILLNVIQKVIVTLTNNWVLTLNLFYLLGYFLCAYTALFVLKKLGISKMTSIVGAVLYSFLPYHFFRGLGHLYLSEYFMVPVMVYYAIRLMNQETIWKKSNGKIVTWNNIGHTVAFICMSLTGVYYAYFVCFFLCVSILYKLLNRVNWKKCRQEIAGILIICVSLISSVLPSVLYWHEYGSNPSAIERSPVGAELYSMKIAQLVLPISGHRIEKIAELRGAFDQYPLSNENTTVSLGLVMTIGFLVLLVSICILHRVKSEDLIQKLVVLNFAALLIGTIGSFSSIIGYLFSMIRCYNRICVFIAMFSIITVCILLDKIGDKLSKYEIGNMIGVIGILLVLMIGIWDQTSTAFVPNYEKIQTEFENDRAFVQQIEQINPNGMIFQMPYVVYPEQGQVNNMIDYSHLRGYLHSSSLKWSYCAVKGRETDEWQKQIANLPMEEQISELEEYGFTGVYIDAFAYTTEELEHLQNELNKQLGDADIVSSNGRLIYYSIN